MYDTSLFHQKGLVLFKSAPLAIMQDSTAIHTIQNFSNLFSIKRRTINHFAPIFHFWYDFASPLPHYWFSFQVSVKRQSIPFLPPNINTIKQTNKNN